MIGMGQNPAGGKHDGAQGDAQGSDGIAHGMGGVRAEIDENLLDLDRISQDHHPVRLEGGPDPDGGRQRGPQHPGRFLDEGADLDHLQSPLFLPAEAQDLPDQIAGAQGRLQNLIQIAPCPVPGRQFPALDDFRVADDDAQDVVEVVGNAPGHGAEGVEFLGVQELQSQALAGGNVLDAALEQGFPALGARKPGVDGHPDVGTVQTSELGLKTADVASLFQKNANECFAMPGIRVELRHAQRRFAQQRFGVRSSENPGQRGIDANETPVEPGLDDAFDGIFEDAPETDVRGSTGSHASLKLCLTGTRPLV